MSWAAGDDDKSVHERAIDQLAAVGIVNGTAAGGYAPAAVVTRGQMARFLSQAGAHVSGKPLPEGGDWFADDDGSPFEPSIGEVAVAGITGGRAPGAYEPGGPVTRAQMASFLARLLDVLVEGGDATADELAQRWPS